MTRYGEMGGDILGNVVMEVLDPHHLADHWRKICVTYMCTSYVIQLEGTGHEVFYVRNDAGNVVLWIWMESK